MQTSAKERQHILAILQRIQQEDASDLATHQDSNDESEDPDEDELELSENLMQKLDLVVHLRTSCQQPQSLQGSVLLMTACCQSTGRSR